MKNIELKVKVDTLEEVRNKLDTLNAAEEDMLRQIDTYFNSEKGRLKLREINETDFELIYYERPDESESKVSTYEIVRFDKDSAEKIKNILGSTNGIKVVVEKRRELWMFKNTRIHLDKVEGLGEYVELETVATDISLEDASIEHNKVIEALNLNNLEVCAVSYSDLLLYKFE